MWAETPLSHVLPERAPLWCPMLESLAVPAALGLTLSFFLLSTE